MAEEKQPPTLEHQEPPIYYCWKYWMSNGEIREGCTPIEPEGHDTWPDLNDYGWVYVAVPVAIVFVVMFLMYLICSKAGSKNQSAPKKSILLEESDSEEDIPPPRSKWSRVQSYHPREVAYSMPSKTANISDFATVVHMAKPDNMAAPERKVYPRGSVGPHANAHGKVYPQLSKKSNGGPRADEEVSVNGRRTQQKTPMHGPAVPPLSHYVSDPTASAWKKKTRAPPTKVTEESSSDDDESENDDAHSEEQNEK